MDEIEEKPSRLMLLLTPLHVPHEREAHCIPSYTLEQVGAWFNDGLYTLLLIVAGLEWELWDRIY